MTPYYEDDLVTLHHGDATAVARTLASGSVQTIVTSPPYFGLRDYGEAGQMGAESTLDEYVSGMVALFRELRRVVADDGTLWLNLGDSYARDPGNGGSGTPNGRNVAKMGYSGGNLADLPEKNLMGVPWRVAFALQADGWILRSDIIWAKPNPMPESVTDRPTKAHEYVFLFAKSPRYHYDAAAIKEPFAETLSNGLPNPRRNGSGRFPGELRGEGLDRPKEAARGSHRNTHKKPMPDHLRNKRTVWEVAAAPFPGAHFAVYPPDLIRPCILAGSRQGDTVLDPFSGSGTTGMVATQEGRKYVGIDLNSDYLDLSLRERFAQPVLNFGVSA